MTELTLEGVSVVCRWKARGRLGHAIGFTAFANECTLSRTIGAYDGYIHW